MNFISISFLIFILAVVVVYFSTPQKFRWLVLLIASYVFYMFSGPKLAIFLMLSTLIAYLTGRWLGNINVQAKEYLTENKTVLSREEKKAYKQGITSRKRRVVTLAAISIIGILVFLKYFNFLGENINSIFHLLHISTEVPKLHLLLPLGISFYSLQAIAYVVDIYREKYVPEKNIGKFALYMSFFPQIIQGPIAKYDEIAPQLYEGHKFDYTRVTMGIQLIIWGFMKKMILADRIAIPVNEIFNHYESYGGITLFFAAAAYGLQVYADFSGGMDIARGVAQMLGIDLSLNFERPYFARSISEFWRRWHISLGAWMREYIFYPLSLSKAFNSLGKKTRKLFGVYVGKKLPTFLSFFIVFFLVGIWHGSSWKYIAYGLWNGIIIVSSILLEPFYASTAKKLGINTECFSWRFFQMVRTFFLCSLGRFFSRAGSCLIALNMIKRTFTEFNPWVLFDNSFLELGLDVKDYHVIALFILILLVVGIMQERGIKIRETIAKQNIYFRWGIYIGAIVLILVLGIYGPGYSASEFIYKQF